MKKIAQFTRLIGRYVISREAFKRRREIMTNAIIRLKTMMTTVSLRKVKY